MKRLAFFTCLAIAALFSACTAEDTALVTETLVSCMRLDAPKPCFDGQTRAESSEWSNGDCVYLTFYSGAECVSGKAIYNAAESSWMLEYDKPVQATESSLCHAYYFEGSYTDNGRTVTLYPTTCVYYDTNGTYKKDANGITVRANMFPKSGRVRFTGTAGQQFTVSGATSFTGYNRADASFNTSLASLPTTVSSAGSTPYLYMLFADDARTLEVAYDRLAFSRYCDYPILDAGQSGYMKLPTKESHSGWVMTETTVPTVGATTVSNVEANTADFSASVVSDGNAAVAECGFVYSQTQNPTIDDMTLKCSASSFTATASDLKKNTTYYVRAYATNAAGTAYGAETSFTTKANLAVTNGLYAYFPFDGDIENHTETEMTTVGIEHSFTDSYDGSQALQIDAKNTSFLQINDPLVDKLNMTVSFWAKDLSDGHVFHAIDNGNGRTFDLSVVDGMLKYIFSAYVMRNNPNRIQAFTNGSLMGWHMITISHSTSKRNFANVTKKLYIDGKLVDTVTEYLNDGSEIDDCMKFVIGGKGYYTSPTKIVMDNFRVYNNRVLASEEIKEIYNSEKQ